MNVDDPINRIANPENIVDKLNAAAPTAGASASVAQVSELSQDLGDQFAGRFIAPANASTSSEPTSTDFSGSFLSGEPQTMGDDTQAAWLAKVNEGIVEFSVGENGIYQNRLTKGYTHIADDGTTYRKGTLGMTVLPGMTAPSFGLGFEDNAPATNLVTNGDFETGDLTGWTAYSGTWNAETGNPDFDGYYAAYTFTLSDTMPVSLSQIISVTSNQTYKVTGRIYCPSYYANIYLYFYSTTDGSGSLISAYNAASVNGLADIEYNFKSPNGAQSVRLELRHSLYAYTIGRTICFDNITLNAVTMSNYLGFEPENGAVVSNIINDDYDTGQVPIVQRAQLPQMLTPTATLSTDVGNVDIGVHYFAYTVSDIFGETAIDVTKAGSIDVTPTAKNVTVTISEQLRFGITGVKLYATIAGASSSDPENYFYVGSVASTSTFPTTLAYNISDADLVLNAQAPLVDTSGSRPQLPTTAIYFPFQFKASGTVNVSVNSSQYFNFYGYSSVTTINNWVEVGVYVASGEYTISVSGRSANSMGVARLWVNNVNTGLSQDWYSAAASYPIKTYTVNLKNGYNVLRFVMSNKNPSSSAYGWNFTAIILTPTSTLY